MDPRSRLVNTCTRVTTGTERSCNHLEGLQVSTPTSVELEVGYWLKGRGQRQKGTPMLSFLHNLY